MEVLNTLAIVDDMGKITKKIFEEVTKRKIHNSSSESVTNMNIRSTKYGYRYFYDLLSKNDVVLQLFLLTLMGRK